MRLSRWIGALCPVPSAPGADDDAGTRTTGHRIPPHGRTTRHAHPRRRTDRRHPGWPAPCSSARAARPTWRRWQPAAAGSACLTTPSSTTCASGSTPGAARSATGTQGVEDGNGGQVSPDTRPYAVTHLHSTLRRSASRLAPMAPALTGLVTTRGSWTPNWPEGRPVVRCYQPGQDDAGRHLYRFRRGRRTRLWTARAPPEPAAQTGETMTVRGTTPALGQSKTASLVCLSLAAGAAWPRRWRRWCARTGGPCRPAPQATLPDRFSDRDRRPLPLWPGGRGLEHEHDRQGASDGFDRDMPEGRRRVQVVGRHPDLLAVREQLLEERQAAHAALGVLPRRCHRGRAQAHLRLRRGLRGRPAANAARRDQPRSLHRGLAAPPGRARRDAGPGSPALVRRVLP